MPIAPWKIYVSVALGSALGGVGRFWISAWIAHRFGAAFPWSTMFVNVSGSLLIGFLAGIFPPEGRVMVAPATREFLMVGLCGGYTTFSTFSLQTLYLMREGYWFSAAMNALLSVTLCMVAVWIGHYIGQLSSR